MNHLKTIATLMILLSGSAHAGIISLIPDSTTAEVNDIVTVDVLIDDLDNEFIGAYDLSTAFDDSVLSLTSVGFDIFLDDPFSIQEVVEGPGSARVSEVSLDLLLNQDGFSGFRLFSLSFMAIAAGTSDLTLDILNLGDDFGGALSAEIRNTQIIVSDAAAAVPAPPALLLFLTGLAGMAIRKRLG